MQLSTVRRVCVESDAYTGYEYVLYGVHMYSVQTYRCIYRVDLFGRVRMKLAYSQGKPSGRWN